MISDDPVRRAARAVVLGRYVDGSGFSEVVYGPYGVAKAEQVARDLTSGSWQSMTWAAVPLGRLPGEQPETVYRGPTERAISSIVGGSEE